MKRSFLLLIIAFGLASFAGTSGSIAILDFDNKALLKETTMQRVGDRLRKEFSVRGGPVVFDRWLIDTLMIGNKQLLKCMDEQCLFAIGHLLSVDQVVGGSITKQNRRYCISADLVDIKNNIASGSVQSFVMDFYDSTLATAARDLVGKLLDLQNVKKIIASDALMTKSSGQKQSVSVRGANSLKESVSSAKQDTASKKPGFIQKYFWYPLAAVVLGSAAAGIWYYKNKHESNPASSDVSLDDAPKHPGSGYSNVAP